MSTGFGNIQVCKSSCQKACIFVIRPGGGLKVPETDSYPEGYKLPSFQPEFLLGTTYKCLPPSTLCLSVFAISVARLDFLNSAKLMHWKNCTFSYAAEYQKILLPLRFTFFLCVLFNLNLSRHPFHIFQFNLTQNWKKFWYFPLSTQDSRLSLRSLQKYALFPNPIFRICTDETRTPGSTIWIWRDDSNFKPSELNEYLITAYESTWNFQELLRNWPVVVLLHQCILQCWRMSKYWWQWNKDWFSRNLQYFQ